MISILLNGVLGNQLFQYATGRMLSLKHNAELTVDLSFINSKLQWSSLATFRKYELDAFELPVLKRNLFIKGKFLYPFSKSEYWLRKRMAHFQYYDIQEDNSGFDLSVLHAPDNSYLEGFFQSEKYFHSIRDIIRNDLRFKQPLSGKNSALSDQIRQTNSISIHYRRGDYVSLGKNLQKYGITGNEYYAKAMAYIVSSVKNPVFYIFSDNPDWVRQNVKTNHSFHIMDRNLDTDTSYIDMHLMSLCQHNIICNSTFSWWGAWLNSNPGKKVIAPARWLADPSINAGHILPDSWIKLYF
ncbi:MAG: alpha-1,2-fucosyltransferase [Desulfosalsimonadaceae bacterium]